MDTIERLRKLVEYTCRAVIDEDHPLAVKAVAGSENLLFEIHCEPGDVGLSIGRNLEAIRTIVRSACRGATIRTSVELCNSRR
jgi:predicted RNA-binding protein YlqC (UPF0109 family)